MCNGKGEGKAREQRKQWLMEAFVSPWGAFFACHAPGMNQHLPNHHVQWANVTRALETGRKNHLPEYFVLQMGVKREIETWTFEMLTNGMGEPLAPAFHVTKANSAMTNEMGRVFHPPTCLVMWENVTRTHVKWANEARAFGTLAKKEEMVDSGGIHHLPVHYGAWTCGSGRIHHLPNCLWTWGFVSGRVHHLPTHHGTWKIHLIIPHLL